MTKTKKPKKAKSKTDLKPARPDDSVIKHPDFEARGKKTLGDNGLNAVEDFLKYRHREWEQ